jgi:hypothetical protein
MSLNECRQVQGYAFRGVMKKNTYPTGLTIYPTGQAFKIEKQWRRYSRARAAVATPEFYLKRVLFVFINSIVNLSYKIGFFYIGEGVDV